MLPLELQRQPRFGFVGLEARDLPHSEPITSILRHFKKKKGLDYPGP
jgi:hypothetical protein